MMGGLLAVVGSANIAAAAIGGPIGSAIVTVVQGAIGLAVLGGNAVTLAEATGALFGFVTKAYGAKTDADYLAAAKDFAKFVNVVGPNFVANNMTGAGASKALGGISRKLASLGGELGKLSPVRQEQIQSGLRAGRDMLGKLGKDIQGGFKGIFESINKALSHLPGNNPKNLTGSAASPNPGGKNPKKKEKTVQPSRWEKETKNIEKSLQQKIETGQRKTEAGKAQSGLVVSLDLLKAKKINPETVTKLTEQGLFPHELNALLDGTRKFPKFKRGTDRAISPDFQEVAELANKYLSQLSKQPELNIEQRAEAVKNLIKYAVSDRQIYKFAKEITNSGKLSNGENLSKTVVNFAEQSNISGALGYQLETEFAAQLVRSGRKISMGSGADVIDHTSKQAWQLKNVDGKNAFNGVLNKAAEQLTGKNEQPLLGYLKNIKLRITGKENPEYLKSPKQLEKSIKESISSNTGGKWGDVNQVQIVIDNKTHVFDIKKSKEGMVPIYKNTYQSAPYTIGELPPETRVAGVENMSPQLLSALEKYRQAVENSPTPEQSKERHAAYQLVLAKQSEAMNQKIQEIGRNIQHRDAQLAGKTFNINEISPGILRNASPTDAKAVAYASAQLLKHSGQKTFVSRDSELEIVKINDTGQVTLYSDRLSVDTAQNILEAAQQLQQEQTMQANKSNNQREMGG
jgi:hypothetical protein